MDHFDDEQEQVSISFDENDVPVLDSEEDSVSSSVFEEFVVFKSNGWTRIHEGNQCYKLISGSIAALGMGNVAAVHKIPRLGTDERMEAFHTSSAEMVERCGGDGNVTMAWYGGSRDEICRIISHGFRRCRQSEHDDQDGFGVHLYPFELAMEGLLTSREDEYGLRHVLLCKVLLGKMEVVRPGLKQFKPSSDEFDSGVDILQLPTKFIIWEAYMNSRIIPNYIVSFRALNVRGFRRDATPICKPTTRSLSFSVLIPKLANLLPPLKMATILKYQSEFGKKWISRAQVVHRLRQVAGDEVLNVVIKQLEGKSTSSVSANLK